MYEIHVEESIGDYTRVFVFKAETRWEVEDLAKLIPRLTQILGEVRAQDDTNKVS